jgi:hypothetical protein
MFEEIIELFINQPSILPIKVGATILLSVEKLILTNI